MAGTPPLSSLSLFPATPEQTIESRIRSFDAWGRGLSLEAYLARDAKVDASEIGRDSRLVTWVLAPRDSPQTLDFMCSCETFRRDGLLAQSSDNNGTTASVDEVVCYGIASLFTPSYKRGKGFARHLMKLLHWVLAAPSSLPYQFPAEWGAPPHRPAFVEPGCCSVLYSDVGEKIYTVCGPTPNSTDGWLVANPNSTTWNTDRILSLSSTTGSMTPPWKLLDSDSVDSIWKMDADLMKVEMGVGHSGLVQFTFLPTNGVASFQCTRLEDHWKSLNPLPKYWGVCLADDPSNINSSIFATWTINICPPENALIVTRMRCTSDAFEKMLSILADYAKQYSIETVEIWNLPEHLVSVASSLGGSTFARHDHLPSIKWYGKDDTKDVSWVYNEKYVCRRPEERIMAYFE